MEVLRQKLTMPESRAFSTREAGRWLLATVLSLASILPLAGLSGKEPTAGKHSQDPSARPASETDPTFKVRSGLVMVPVSVTDAAGRAVRGLRIGDFRIEEQGEPETISIFGEPGEAMLDLALLFDVSASIKTRFDFQKQSATSFLKLVLKPRDSVSIFSIGNEPTVVQRRTLDLADALRSLETIQPTREPTAFFDTVVLAARDMVKTARPDARRVVIVLSDGEDNRSTGAKLADAAREVQQADCIFYAINPVGKLIQLNKISLEGQEAMEEIAKQTGGTAFTAEEPEDLAAIFARIARELEAQYLLGYYSSNTRFDGSFRRIVVRVSARPDLRVWARQGYYATAR